MELDLDQWMDYEEFVPERHRIWERRQAGEPGPWTTHPVLAVKKFTNVFRIADPGTQFILTDIAPGLSERDAFAALLLYRLTNHVPMWRDLLRDLGRAPGWDDLAEEGRLWELLTWYNFEGRPVFGRAYIVYPGPAGDASRGTVKIKVVLERIRSFLVTEAAERAVTDDLETQFRQIVSHRGLGEFTAMQVGTDYGYLFGSREREDSFVYPGPGATRGALRIAPRSPADATTRWAWEWWMDADHAPVLAGRKPSLMDVQNTLCEHSKLARYLERPTGSGKPYVAAHPGAQPDLVLPSWWTEGRNL